MTETPLAAMDNGYTKFTRDAGGNGPAADRRGSDRPQGDSRLPAHIMAEPSRLEASGPYEWLAIVEAHDAELSGLLRGYIESCRYLDELHHPTVDLGRTRLADRVRDAMFASDSMKRSLDEVIKRKSRAD